MSLKYQHIIGFYQRWQEGFLFFETAESKKNETLLYRWSETKIPPAEDGIVSAGGIF